MWQVSVFSGKKTPSISTHSNVTVTCSSVRYSLSRLEKNLVKCASSYNPDCAVSKLSGGRQSF